MGMSVLALPRPAEPVRRRALWLSRLVRRRATVVGLVLLAVTTLVGVLAPVIAGDPLRMEVSARLTAPGAAHWFGTDDVGRDVWSRVVRSEEHTSELQSPFLISYAVFCL